MHSHSEIADCFDRDSAYPQFMTDVGVPKNLRGARIEDVDAERWNIASSALSNGRGVYAHGLVGRGKSYLAAAILRWLFIEQLARTSTQEDLHDAATRINKRFKFVDVSTYLYRLRDTFSANSRESETALVDALCNYNVLVMDDLGVSKPTEWALQTLDLVVNWRYSNEKMTIVTSNLTLTELGAKYGDRIASRISSMCEVLEIGGADRRLTTK